MGRGGEKAEGREGKGLKPPQSKFSGYVAALIMTDGCRYNFKPYQSFSVILDSGKTRTITCDVRDTSRRI